MSAAAVAALTPAGRDHEVIVTSAGGEPDAGGETRRLARAGGGSAGSS